MGRVGLRDWRGKDREVTLLLPLTQMAGGGLEEAAVVWRGEGGGWLAGIRTRETGVRGSC